MASINMDGQPPSKRQKIQLSELPALLEHSEMELKHSHNAIKDTPMLNISELSKQLTHCTQSEFAGAGLVEDYTQEEREEETQVQASLPLYLDHIFGTHIGQSQIIHSAHTQLSYTSSETTSSFAQSPRSPNTTTQTQSCYQDTAAMLDSQGLMKKPLYTSYSTRSIQNDAQSSSSGRELIKHTELSSMNNSLVVVGGCSTQHLIPESQCFTVVPCTQTKPPLLPSTASPDIERDCDGDISPVLFDSPSVSKQQVCLDNNQLEEKPFKIADNDHVHCQKSVPMKRRDLSCVHPSVGDTTGYVCPLMCTPLAECIQVHASVSVFAMILQVNPVMEVACKTGYKAGSTVPMSSLLLGDPTKAYFKLSLWREAAVWVERFSAGDVVLFKNIKLKSWLKEIVGSTVMHSSVLNFHQPKKPLPKKVTDIISLEKSLDRLMQWARKYHGYLVSGNSPIPKSQRMVNFCASKDFGTETIVHFRAKLLTVISSRVLLVADEPGMEVHLHILGIDASLWCIQLSKGGVGRVWEFMFLAVSSESATQGGAHSLQTTSRSLVRPVKDDSEIGRSILARFSSGSSFPVVRGCTIDDVVARQSSGLFELNAKATSAEFVFFDGTNLSLSLLVQLEPHETISQLCQAVYVGCESCSRPLKQDDCGIYQQCLACMIKKPGGYPSSSYYFSSVIFTLQDSSASVRVATSHLLLPKVLGIHPLDIVKASLAKDFNKCSKIKKELQEALSTIQDEHTNWTVSCVFTKDENSFVEGVNMMLLDWSTDTPTKQVTYALK